MFYKITESSNVIEKNIFYFSINLFILTDSRIALTSYSVVSCSMLCGQCNQLKYKNIAHFFFILCFAQYSNNKFS